MVVDGSSSVVRCSLAPQRSTDCVAPTLSASLHRRFSAGVGGTPRDAGCLGPVDSAAAESTHKSLGDGSGAVGSVGLPSLPQRVPGSSQNRQHLCSVLPQQARGGALSFAVEGSRSHPALDAGMGHFSDGPACSRLSQCHCGRAKQKRHHKAHRVDSGKGRSGTGLEPLVQANGRSFCYSIQSSSPDLCLSSSGRRSMGSGCLDGSLVKPARLRLSSIRHSGKGDSKSKDRGGPSHSHCPLVASSAMVPRPDVSVACPAIASSIGSAVSVATKVGRSARKPAGPPASRLDVVRGALSARGASASVVDLVALALRKGTQSVYASQWKRWGVWCRQHKVKPLKPTPVELANFLASLSVVHKLSASSIKCHRAAICTTIRQAGGPDFACDPLLRDVTRGVTLAEARSPRRIPAWDLFLVLNALRQEPFEPLNLTSFRLLTFKTFFFACLSLREALLGGPRA